jgi:RNA polymerase sigma-70 factor (ECF subfamily)
VRDPEDQRDVLQEVFIKAYRNLNSFDTALSFSSWIYRIAHNEAVSWFRKHNVRPEGHLVADSDEVLSIIGSSEASPEQQFDQAVNAEAVAAALAQIEKKYRDVLVLRFFEHKEYEEISDILKLPVGSVGTLIHRGKKQLATALNHDAIRI